jgi:ABC-type nitrate/sulfonate/bicarbonate transport system substrate-binding protein
MGKIIAKIWLLMARARLVMLQVVFTDLIIGLIFVCSSISLAAGGEPTEFSVGISGNGVTIFSLWMAQAGGFYKKEGLNVEVIDMEGSTRGIQVLLSGKIHVMHAGLGPVLQANRQGADLRIVAATSNSIPFTFFAASDVKTGTDLKGGIVAIGTFGSEGDIAVTRSKAVGAEPQGRDHCAGRRILEALHSTCLRPGKSDTLSRTRVYHRSRPGIQSAGRSRCR